MPTTPTEQALKKLEDQLTCAICLDSYTDPKLLNCFHVFCTKCLQPLVCQGAQGQTIQCPNCRQPTTLPQNGVPGLQGAFHIHHLFDIQSALKKVTASQDFLCDKCKRDKATHFCHNCGQFICQGCVMVHQMWEELSSHEVITIQQLTSDAAKLVPSKKQAMPCSKHPDKQLDLYCETCEELICRDCIVKVHRDHQYDLVGDAFSKHKNVIVASLQPVEQQLVTVSKALEGLDTRCGQITEQQKAIEADIETSIRQLHEALEVRKQDLIGQLEQMTRQKLKSLAAQQDQFELMGTQLRSCRDFVQESLRTESKAEILAMKKPVVKQIREMTSSFKPEALALHEQADMKFSHNQPELVRACQEFGRVHTHPVCPEKCCVSTPGVRFAVVGETAIITLLAMDQEGQVYQRALEDVNSELVSSDGSVRVTAKVKGRGGNKYEINYRPQRRGHHHLHIRVEGRHISGSPFSVVAQPKELTAIRTIECVDNPWRLTFNGRGEMVVAEYGGHCISILSANGEKIKSFGSQGSGPGQLQNPIGVTVDGQGNMLMCDHKNHRIQKFSPDGTFLKSVGIHGSGPLQFKSPYGIAIHPHTNKVYAADTHNNCIQVLNEDLTFSSTFGSRGSNNGQFSIPCDVAFDSDGYLYVADNKNHRIQVFKEGNQYVKEFRNVLMKIPFGVTVYGGVVYVADYGSRHLLLFSTEGKLLRWFKPFDAGPHGVAVDDSGLIYVCYGHKSCIKVY